MHTVHVKDKIGDLGSGVVLDTYQNHYCGPAAVEMLTIRFEGGQYADRLPAEVEPLEAVPASASPFSNAIQQNQPRRT